MIIKILRPTKKLDTNIRLSDECIQQGWENFKSTYTFVSLPGLVLGGLGVCAIVSSISGVFTQNIYSAGFLALGISSLAAGLMFIGTDDNAVRLKCIQPQVEPEQKEKKKYNKKKKLEQVKQQEEMELR